VRWSGTRSLVCVLSKLPLVCNKCTLHSFPYSLFRTIPWLPLPLPNNPISLNSFLSSSLKAPFSLSVSHTLAPHLIALLLRRLRLRETCGLNQQERHKMNQCSRFGGRENDWNPFWACPPLEKNGTRKQTRSTKLPNPSETRIFLLQTHEEVGRWQKEMSLKKRNRH
jgi:hypothetical protein